MKEINFTYIYHSSIPDFMIPILDSEAMNRLKDIGMNCGCQYTQYPIFKNILDYSRYSHSVGVGLITYHFTHDPKAAIAGLLHDLSTPAFAHVIDFLHHDHLHQEYTEINTTQFIQNDHKIMNALDYSGIKVEEVNDYHQYPVADNDTPKLSADRLEYTLGNMVNYGFGTISQVERIYHDLIVGINEYGEEEIMFQHSEIAIEFANLSMQCSKVYVADEDRYAMESLAIIIRDAISAGVLTEQDLYLTETEVIHRLESNPKIKKKWENFCNSSIITTSNTPVDSSYLKINAKKRYIDPYIQNSGRVSEINSDYHLAIEKFLNDTFDYYISGHQSTFLILI